MSSPQIASHPNDNEKVLKLAENFINIIDYHADPMTGISHSSGTISYDSIPVANGRNDRRLYRLGDQCTHQPPPHHYICKIKKLKDDLGMANAATIELEAFQNIRREKFARSQGMTSEVKKTKKWTDMNLAVENYIEEALQNLKIQSKEEISGRKLKTKTQIRIEIPIVKGQDYEITRKTMNHQTILRVEDQVNEKKRTNDYFKVAERSTRIRPVDK